jgi:hypothetical protein
MVFYLAANIAMLLFGRNDPAHFGALQDAMVNLFRISTFDGWTDILYANMLGCNHWMYSLGRADVGWPNSEFSQNFGSKVIMKADKSNCNHPEAFGWIAAAFFLGFALLSGQVLITLFVGIIATSMEEAKMKNEEDAKRQVRLEKRVKQLHILPAVIDIYRELFDKLNTKGDLYITRDQFKGIAKSVSLSKTYKPRGWVESALVATAPEKNTSKDVANGYDGDDERPIVFTRLDFDKMFEILYAVDEYFQSAHIEFGEFIVYCEVLRRSTFDGGLVRGIREAFARQKELAEARKALDGPGADADNIAKTFFASIADGKGFPSYQ